MLGEILLKMVSVLTPDDIRQMKAAGCGDEVRAILGELDKLAVSWHDGGFGEGSKNHQEEAVMSVKVADKKTGKETTAKL